MIEINLLEEKGKAKPSKKKRKRISINLPGSITIIIFLVAIEVVALFYVSYSMNRTIQDLKRKRDRLSAIERQVNRIKIKIREVRNMVNAVKKLEKGRGRAARILEEVADAIPKGTSLSGGNIVTVSGSLWLTRLTKKGNILYIEGKSFSAEAVADYMMNLEAIKDVSKVRFSSSGLRKISSKDGIDVYAFSITVTLKG